MKPATRPFFIVLISALLFSGCSQPVDKQPEPIRPIKIHEVHPGLFNQAKEFPAVTRASRRADLSFRFGGRLTELPIEEGQMVEEGALIARLDPRDLESRRNQVQAELEQAEAKLDQMTAGARSEDLRQLEATVTARQSEAELTENQAVRMKQLLDEQAISQLDYDRARSNADVAKAQLESAKENLAAAQSGARDEEIAAQEAAIRGIRSRLEEVENSLMDTELRAPFRGVIAQNMVENFQDVQALQPVARLHDLSRIHVIINVTEADMARGNEQGIQMIEDQVVVAYATFPALPNMSFPLRAREFQTEADPTTQTFQVVLELEQSRPFLVKSGMNAVVQSLGLNDSKKGPGLLIPLSALISSASDGATAVWVVDPTANRVTRRKVTTAESFGDKVRIVEGLTEGELIANSAVNMLREGMAVRQMTDPREL